MPHWRHSLRDGKFLQSQLGQLQSSYRARSTPIDWSCSRILSAVSAHASTHTSADYDAGLLAAEGQLPLYYIPTGSKVMQLHDSGQEGCCLTIVLVSTSFRALIDQRLHIVVAAAMASVLLITTPITASSTGRRLGGTTVAALP